MAGLSRVRLAGLRKPGHNLAGLNNRCSGAIILDTTPAGRALGEPGTGLWRVRPQ